MNRDRAQELKEFAQTIADRFSNPTRVGNQNHETFSVDEVIPISDDSAVINFKKTSEISAASGVVLDSSAKKEFNENFIKAKSLLELFK